MARALRMPPQIIAKRMLTELNARTDRYRASRRARGFDDDALLEMAEAANVAELWTRLADRVYAIPIRLLSVTDYERACPEDGARILRKATDALARRVNLLGTGPVQLGSPIDWHCDFKTGDSWPPIFMRDINYSNLGHPSDVKVPWEISRLQWLIPAGQAYLLTADERYAQCVRKVLDEWIDANPYAHGVNWACTMEVAMRILTWTWFFHVFSGSRAWADEAFQSRFLRTLYLHGEFTERYLERSDINGNHLTADAVGLVFAGLFFRNGAAPRRWAEGGWRLLNDELSLQVFEDGVDFEGSVAYHRLVLELFFLGARYREAGGLPVSDDYRARLVAMARFSLAYSRPNGSAPLTGDADDARTFPFGGQPINDHRYLMGLIGAHWNVRDLMGGFSGPRAEIFWTLGPRTAASLVRDREEVQSSGSAAFPQGGFYIMRNRRDHVFIDCGPVGQGGRGGHGHNDCLSFEAVLDGTHLISDCGAYLYTADAHERNRFRSTAYHNTPQIDDEEINRFVRWDHLWTLHNDAVPSVSRWEPGTDCDVFVGTHSGYQRLRGVVGPVRRIVLNHQRHALTVTDVIEGAGDHSVTIPLHLAPGVDARCADRGRIVLTTADKEFSLLWSSDAEWTVDIEPARVSPSYGVVVPSVRLVWRHKGFIPTTLTMTISGRESNRRTSRDNHVQAAA